MDKYQLGWSQAWDRHVQNRPIKYLARVTARFKHSYKATTTCGDRLDCTISGKMLYRLSLSDLPTVGDWCLIGEESSDNTSAVITDVLPRQSKIARKVAGMESIEQVIAANVDITFIVTSANSDFSINRLQRYIVLAEYGCTQPIIVLSKMDLVDDHSLSAVDELNRKLGQIRRVACSSITMTGIDEIKSMLPPGKTAVFVGSSGVGKSTLVNLLLDRNVQKTNAIREADGRGKHTTTSSGMFFIPDAGIIIDTPGLREVQLVGDTEDLGAALPAVTVLAKQCRFNDCSHRSEPGCQVLSAIEEGVLDKDEFDSYVKLEREIAFAKRKADKRLASEERQRWKKLTKDYRSTEHHKRRR